MKFSEAFSITKDANDDWFDPILNFDTRLFIDPFLIFKHGDNLFSKAHEKIITFFNEALKIVAETNGNKDVISYKKARLILIFPEVSELYLGYSFGDNKGAGSSYKFSELMIEAIWIAIQKGIKNIQHFEELEILNEGIGADRISDMTANILKEELIKYTNIICKKYNIPMAEIQVKNSSFDSTHLRWLNEKVYLPLNPKDKTPIILVPQKFLNKLPEIISSDFGDYLISFENERLRNDFNYNIAKKMDKKTIVEIARKAPDIVEKYIKRKEELSDPKAYDFFNDPENHRKWHDIGKIYTENNPITLTLPNDNQDFFNIIASIINSFKSFIEVKGGNELLVNDDGSQKKESASQRTFAGIAIPYCQQNNIDITKEANMGRGPVDFKFSNGYNKRMLIEVKKASTISGLFRKIEKQLPEYMKSEDVKNGIYLIIRYSKRDDERIKEIEKIIHRLNEEDGLNIGYHIINAEKLPSASKL